jgi:hypothetical protein
LKPSGGFIVLAVGGFIAFVAVDAFIRCALFCWSQLLAKKGSDRHSVIALFRRFPSGVALAVLIVRERGPGL